MTMYHNILETDEVINDVSYISCKAYEYTKDKNSGLIFLQSYDKTIDNMAIFPNGFSATNIEYRGYKIHILPFGNYNLFYIVDETNLEVIILRVLYQKQNWQRILGVDDIYHIRNNEYKKIPKQTYVPTSA